MKKQKNENVSYLSEVLDKLKEHKMAMAGLVVLILEILMVVFLPIILNLDPYTSDYTAFSAAPSGAHILGTDAIGRDVFARLMYGGRTSLLVGFVSTLISCAIGVPLGLVAGYARGKAEAIIMRKTLSETYTESCMCQGVFCVEKACNGTDHGLSSALMLLLSFQGSCSGVSQNESEEGDCGGLRPWRN